MATPTIKIAVTFSKTKVIVTDTTGDYDVATNPGGYGTPNNPFSDYAHFVILRKKNVNSVADALMTLDSSDPITDTVFQATRSVDGWYEAAKLTIPIWTAGTYASGTVKFYNGVIYKANASTSSAPPHATWDVVTDLTTIEGNTSITTTYDGRVTAYNADVYWSKKIAGLAQAGSCGVCEDDKMKARLDNIYRNIQIAIVADSLGLNTSGEWVVLRLILLGAV